MPGEPHPFTLAEAQPILRFVNERHAIWMRREILRDQAERGLERPDLSNAGRYAWGNGDWTLEHLTNDPVMARWKFCNVFRELDRVTVWVRKNIREPYADHPHLWFMLAAARFINWPPALQFLIDGGASWPDHRRFNPKEMSAALEALKAAGRQVETGAYMIRAENSADKPWSSWSKQRYVAEIVLGRPWRDRKAIARQLEQPGQTLAGTWQGLSLPSPWGAGDWVGWGPFMAGQVVADLRHTRYLREAPDVGAWAPVGIGSARGLNRLAGRKVTAAVPQEQGQAEMKLLQTLINAHSGEHVPPIELHDVQNCLCETDKHLRVLAGEGRPRSGWPTRKEDW